MKRLSFVLLGALLFTGCLGSVDPVPQRKYGFIIMNARAVGSTYVTSPLGIFYQSAPLALPSSTPREFCYAGLHDSTGTGINPSLNHLDAGEFIAMTLSGADAELVPIDTLSAVLYRPSPPVAYTPGDTAVFSSDGGLDFEPFSARIKTSEPFTMTPIGLPAAGANLALQWTPPNVPGSKMIVSLRWENEGEPNTTNLLYCDLADDGAFSIPSSQVIGWRLAATRQAFATRERTVTPTAVGATLRIISNFEIEVPVND